MADMTHKHHNLIYDAIKDAAISFVNTDTFMKAYDENPLVAGRLLRDFVNALAKSFSEKLRYTNDKFECDPWGAGVRSIANECVTRMKKNQGNPLTNS